MPDYSYQADAAAKTISALKKRGKVVLAGAVGSGKTTITQLVINRLVQELDCSRIVVVTENLCSLRDQFLSDLECAHVPIQFSWSRLEDSLDTQVKIGTASSLKKLNWSFIDVLIFDEGHRHYGERRINEFIQKTRPRIQVVLTGSPSKFIRKNEKSIKKIPIVTIPGAELLERSVYAPVDLFVSRLSNPAYAYQSIHEVMRHVARAQVELSKVLIVTPSIRYAEEVFKYINSNHENVFLSTSKNDPNNSKIKGFLKSKSGLLVTVNKCIMGFNCPDLDVLIDFKSSANLDVSNQIFARILRKSVCGKRKSYFRVSGCQTKSYNQQVMMLHKLVALMEKEIFEKFNGKNLRLMPCE